VLTRVQADAASLVPALARHDRLGRGGQAGGDVAEVGAAAGPAVRQDDRRPRAGPVVRQPETAGFSTARHRPSLRPAGSGWRADRSAWAAGAAAIAAGPRVRSSRSSLAV
jgi:hypothetical protein